MAQLRTRRRNGRIQYYNPETKKFQNTKPKVTKPTSTPKPDPNNKFSSASQKGSRNFSGSTSSSSGGAGYADDIAKLKELAKRRGPQAKAAAAKLAKLGIRVAPGAVIGGAMLTTSGKPGQSRMSKFGSLTGRQAPVAKPRPSNTRQFQGPGGDPSGSGKGQAQQKPGTGPYQGHSKPKSNAGGSGGGRNNVTPTPPKKKTGANDPRNAAYIAARKKLNSNSTKAERDKVRDMGLALSKSIHGDKGGRGSKKPETSKPANVGPVKDGAKYARSLAKSGVRRGAKNAAKADNRLQATESVRAGMRQGRTADKNNEKKKKQRRFSNESLRRAGQRTYNRGAA